MSGSGVDAAEEPSLCVYVLLTLLDERNHREYHER